MLKSKLNLINVTIFTIFLVIIVSLGLILDLTFSLFKVNTYHLSTIFLLALLSIIFLWDISKQSVVKAMLELLQKEHKDISEEVIEIPKIMAE